MKFDNQQDSTNPYKTDFLSKIPSWLKILILKYWAAAAAVFFVGMGGAEIGLDWSQVGADDYWLAIELGLKFFIVLTFVLAFFMNYIVKMFGLMMHTSRNPIKKYLFITKRGFIGFVYNILYGFVVMIPVFFVTTYLSQNNVLPTLFGDDAAWGLDPLAMGLFYVLVDFVFMTIKTLLVGGYKRYKVYKINNAE